MRILHFCLLCAGLLWGGCQQNNTDSAAETFPNTPEGVVRQYQAYLDKNEFDKAKRISTDAEQERLELLKGIITGELLESSTMTTQFTQLSCQETRNTAICIGAYVEDGEAFEDTFYLEKVDERWLVTITEEIAPPVIIKSEEVVK